MRVAVIAAMAIVAAGISRAGRTAVAPAGGNAACFTCHAMATLAERDSATGRLVHLAVDPSRYAASNHRRLACTGCHAREFSRIPHGATLRAERLRCLDCHRGDSRLAAYGFAAIGVEVRRSVHAVRIGRDFGCFRCHDPHAFTAPGQAPADRIAAANGICLACHADRMRFGTLSARALPDLAVAHAWLPAEALHRRAVRCVDCHAAREPGSRDHLIMPAAAAVRACTGCHSRDSVLLTKLYKHASRERRAAYGFVNAALLNDAYVVGATRNLVLDRLSLAAAGLALAGIAAHAWLRWRGRPGGRP